jgi:hypothetical protein
LHLLAPNPSPEHLYHLRAQTPSPLLDDPASSTKMLVVLKEDYDDIVKIGTVITSLARIERT